MRSIQSPIGTAGSTTLLACLAALLFAFGASPARATVAAPTDMITFDITGTYNSTPNDPVFQTSDFDFSVLLPETIDGSYASGTFTPTDPLSLIGVYTDGSFSTDPTDISVTMKGTQSSNANEIIDFTIDDPTVGTFDIKITDTTNSLWDITGTTSATLTLNAGVYDIDGTEIKGNVTKPTTTDPTFTGTLRIPEPPAAFLLGFGLLAMLGVTRRRLSRL